VGTESLDGVDNDAARAIADAIPALVDQLLAVQPGRVRKEILRLVERAVFARVLAVTGGNQLRAARLLGMNRNTLHKHCRLLNLVAPRAEVGSEAG
jgi:two-component system nitrogen regulation response regulator GlnG